MTRQSSRGINNTKQKTQHFKVGVPGRLFISSVNFQTSKIQQYADYHLQPIVREIPSYIKDVSDFLSKLKSITEVSENFYLARLDLKSLYTSIPNSERIKVVKISHEKLARKVKAPNAITTFLAPILTLNNIIFKSKHF